MEISSIKVGFSILLSSGQNWMLLRQNIIREVYFCIVGGHRWILVDNWCVSPLLLLD